MYVGEFVNHEVFCFAIFIPGIFNFLSVQEANRGDWISPFINLLMWCYFQGNIFRNRHGNTIIVFLNCPFNGTFQQVVKILGNINTVYINNKDHYCAIFKEKEQMFDNCGCFTIQKAP